MCHSSKRRFSAGWWSFDLEFLESFCNNKFGISITALNEIPFTGEPWIHLFNSLVDSSIYLFPQEPEGKRKRFLRQKTTLSYIMSMVFDEMVLPVCDQGYSIVQEAAVSLSLLVDGILCSLLSDGLSLSLYLVLCRFSPVSVLYVLLQCWHVKCSFDKKFWLTILSIVPGLFHCWHHLMSFCFALAHICFWLNLIFKFISELSLSCTDLCKFITKDNDHVIS